MWKYRSVCKFGYLTIPPKELYLDEYILSFDKLAELEAVVPNFQKKGQLPHRLSAKIPGEGRSIQFNAVEPLSLDGLTTKDSYTLEKIARLIP